LYQNKHIAVVVPAHNEEKMIGRVITTMPDFVDKIVVVNDASGDRTSEVVRRLAAGQPDRVVLIEHPTNRGVGGAISTGYKWARDNGMDVAAVMAGDGQMNPHELERVIKPVVEERAKYAKGNRLFTGQAWVKIPKRRYLGNAVLSLLTKIASGYWHVADSQCGYTAISRRALRMLDLDRIYRTYGMPNDLLVRLNVCEMRVIDVPVEPLYNIGEKSGLKIHRVVFSISWLLFKLFFWRMKEKYIIRDFHPLVFFYILAMMLLPLGILNGLSILYFNTPLFGYHGPRLEVGYIILCSLLCITGMQSLMFGMWFDMDYNRSLYVFNQPELD